MALSKHALTTIDAVKAELPLTGDPDPKLDGVVARLINSASDSIRSHCRRDFARQTIREDFFIGDDRNSILLSLTPVVSVDGVFQGPDEDNPVEGYELEARPGILRLRYGTWPKNKLVHVNYTGGYVTPHQAAQDPALERNLPYDIEEACIITAATRFQYLGQPADIQIMQVEQIRVHFAEGGRKGLPEAALELLEPYKGWT